MDQVHIVIVVVGGRVRSRRRLSEQAIRAIIDRNPRPSDASRPTAGTTWSGPDSTGAPHRAVPRSDVAGRRDQRRQLEHPHRPDRPRDLRDPNVVARIYDPAGQIYLRLGIPTVATVSWTIDQSAGGSSPAESSRMDRFDRDAVAGRARAAERWRASAWPTSRPRRHDRGGGDRAGWPAWTSPTCRQDGDVLHVMVSDSTGADERPSGRTAAEAAATPVQRPGRRGGSGDGTGPPSRPSIRPSGDAPTGEPVGHDGADAAGPAITGGRS